MGFIPQTRAQKHAGVLERKRRELLGELAEIVLLATGTAGNTFDEIVTVAHSFYVARKSNLAIGGEYLEAEIAEQTGVTHAAVERLIAARFAGRTYKASVVDEFIDSARVLCVRLTPGEG